MATAPSSTPPRASAYSVDELPLDRIAAWDLNPRRRFDIESLEQLAASIRQDGLLDPLVVRLVGGPLGESYQLVAGERRYRAAGLAGLSVVPARVYEDLDDATALRMAISENERRADLNPIERAEGYAALRELGGMTQGQVAEMVGLDQSTIANVEGLLRLPDDVQELIRGGQLSAAHGRGLARFADFPRAASRIGEIAAQNGHSSKDLEAEKLPYANALRGEGLITALNDSRIIHASCARCPFGAFREGSWSGSGWCLKPEHYAELVAARESEQTARVATAEQEAAQEGVEVLRLQDLSYSSYERLESPVAGCDSACPCRAQAIDWSGRRVPICTNPKRHAGLQRAESVKRNRSLRTDADELLAKLEKEIAFATVGPRELAVLVMEIGGLQGNSSAIAKAAATLDHRPEPDPDLAYNVSLDKLAAMPVQRLLRAALLGVLTRKISEGKRLADPSYLQRPRWYLEPEQAAAAEAQVIAEAAEAGVFCPDCVVAGECGGDTCDCERCIATRSAIVAVTAPALEVAGV